MIKPQELRVGNHVDCVKNGDVKRDCIVLSIGPDSVALRYKSGKIGAMLTSLQPIVVSQDFIIKAGFESNQDEHEEEWFHKDEDLFGMKEDVLHPDWSDEKPKWTHIWDNAFTASPVDSVHQLQNLYFAMTGTELKIC